MLAYSSRIICKDVPTTDKDVTELKMILEGLPQNIPNGNYKAEAAIPLNAKVFIDSMNRLSIWPETGGWLGIDINSADLLDDVAPYSD